MYVLVGVTMTVWVIFRFVELDRYVYFPVFSSLLLQRKKNYCTIRAIEILKKEPRNLIHSLDTVIYLTNLCN